MKHFLALTSSALMAASVLSAPSFASAQAYHTYGRYDPCYAAKHRAATNGTVTGGILGAIAGSAIAGRGSRLGGAVVGGTVGAVAGHSIGSHSVRCLAYPPRYRPRPNCHWVEQDYGGRGHQFELCRGPGGEWRPSGRRY
jgi:hypothetical protein